MDKYDDGWRRAAPNLEVHTLAAMPLEWKEDRSKQQYWLMAYTRDFYQPYYTEKWMPPNIVFDEMLQEEMTDIETALTGIVNMYSTEFITGVRDPKGGEWNDYLVQLQRAGVDRYVEVWEDVLGKLGY